MRRGTSSTHKKVVIHKLDSGLVNGYVDPQAFLGPNGIEGLDREGHLLGIPLEQVKGVFFVRDFEGDRLRPERKVFLSRPKLSGLWIRMTFKDNDVMEGLISNNLLDIGPQGFLVIPPDLSSNNLKVFVPRSALLGLEVLGVISDGAARRSIQRGSAARRKVPEPAEQIGLFAFPTQSGSG